MFKKLALVALISLGMSFSALANDTIDGSSEEAAMMSFMEMLQDAPPEQQEEASMAIVLIFYDGLTMEDVEQDPELEEPSFARILDDIDGLTVSELIARADEAEGPIVDLVREQEGEMQQQ